ncbi:aminotransferase [Pseudonocardia endophytica]|nr:aminotransferase [Pseudonocardia endophytica]
MSPRAVSGIDSPIGAAKALLARWPGGGTLLDLSQAAPPWPAPAEIVDHVRDVAREDRLSGYTPVPGIPKLRSAVADELSRDYAGAVEPGDVVVTAGCNQAFCVVAAALTTPGDEVVTPLPYYFNHDMWLRMNGVRPVYLEPGDDLVPRASDAAALITERTRAISLVTPGNPSGVTIPPEVIAEFAELAARYDVALVLDETYRSFRDTDAPPHALFADPAWRRTVVSLHSFSKDLAIPGYRVGAVVASPELGREVLKVMDCVAICSPQIGQEAAWAGLTGARAWRADRAAEIARRRAAFAEVMADRPGGFEMLALGGFFAWVRHPFDDRPTPEVVEDLLLTHDTLVIPGTAFLPDDRRTMRISVSNADSPAIALLADRLRAIGTRSTHGIR